jgi:hypothetical protein
MYDPQRPPLMDGARRRAAGHDEPAPQRPGPIGGPRRPFALSPVAYAAIAAIVFVAGLVFLPAILSPTAAPVAQEAAAVAQEAQAAAPAAPAPRPGPIAVLAPGAVAYAEPDGAELGDVAGRAVLAYRERIGVSWVRAEVEGSGDVWLRMGALAGNAVDLGVIPCGTTCVPGPMTEPTATAAPYVAPAPAYVAPEPERVVATLEAPAVELSEAPPAPTTDRALIPTARPNEPTPCPIVMTQCQAPLVVVP